MASRDNVGSLRPKHGQVVAIAALNRRLVLDPLGYRSLQHELPGGDDGPRQLDGGALQWDEIHRTAETTGELAGHAQAVVQREGGLCEQGDVEVALGRRATRRAGSEQVDEANGGQGLEQATDRGVGLVRHAGRIARMVSARAAAPSEARPPRGTVGVRTPDRVERGVRPSGERGSGCSRAASYCTFPGQRRSTARSITVSEEGSDVTDSTVFDSAVAATPRSVRSRSICSFALTAPGSQRSAT